MNKPIKMICIPGLIVFMIGIMPASAQVGFGPKAGINITNLEVSDPQASYDSRTGYHGGFFLRDKFGAIAVQPEFLLFTQQNKIRTTLLNGTIEDRFTYFSVPLMFKFYPLGGLNLQAGPQFGFLIDGDRTYETELFTGTRDIKDDYKGTDASISLGGGWDTPFGLTLDVRYNIGVKDINDVADGEEARSKVFLISLGWNFVKP